MLVIIAVGVFGMYYDVMFVIYHVLCVVSYFYDGFCYKTGAAILVSCVTSLSVVLSNCCCNV